MPNRKIRNIKILSFITVLLVFVMGILSIYSLRRLENNISWVNHTRDVIQVSDELYISMVESENNIRAYALTNNPAFGDNYRNAKERTRTLVDTLKRMTGGNPEQQHNLELLEWMLKERLIVLDNAFSFVVKHGNLEGYVFPVRVQNALELSAKIKQQLKLINENELQMLRTNNQGLSRNLNALPGFFLFIALISFGTAGLAFYSIHQYNQYQRQSSRQITIYQQQLRDQIVKLDASNKELEQFAYIASHDLQEPLRKIAAFSELLKEQMPEKEGSDSALYIDRISNAAARMRNLITDLLNYSRVSRHTQKEATDLNKVLTSVIEDLELLIEEKKAVLLHSELPVVTGNQSELGQLFLNLISNSLKFVRKEVSPEIRISAAESPAADLRRLGSYDPRNQYVSIKFEDNGIGFSQEYADKIFVIFQRLHGRDKYEGTGIGLAVCKKIAEKYGGTIYAESNEKFGACFTVILPKEQQVQVS